MLSYVYFGTNDLDKATMFYDAALAPLGMRRCITNDPDWDRISAGWGIYEEDGGRELAFWIGKPFNQQPPSVGNGSMVAFRGSSWNAVDDFHAAALANGGRSDGGPGLRPQYGPDFYAAYVRDPDGNKVAAVCRGFRERHLPESAELSKNRFVVSIYEVREEFVFAEEFTGRYTKSVTLSDGTTRTLELTPMTRNGMPAIELKDTGGRTYMGIRRVGTGGATNGNLMIRVFDLTDLDAARVETWSRRLPASGVLPQGTSLLSMPEFVPPGFTQGIEVLNDNTTPMKFVVDVLSAYAGLSAENANETMFAIHMRGGALIPTHSLADAQRIAAQITAEAAEHNYPLICRPVKSGS